MEEDYRGMPPGSPRKDERPRKSYVTAGKTDCFFAGILSVGGRWLGMSAAGGEKDDSKKDAGPADARSRGSKQIEKDSETRGRV